MITSKAYAVLEVCQVHGIMLAIAESCTGGMVSAAITDIPGSSSVLERGFVTYTDKSKHGMLGVSKSTIDTYGAVSEEVALAMAEGALIKSDAQISVAITGIAGPTGATETKPVGLVYVACARIGQRSTCHRFEFTGDRASVREQSVTAALDIILEMLG